MQNAASLQLNLTCVKNIYYMVNYLRINKYAVKSIIIKK